MMRGLECRNVGFFRPGNDGREETVIEGVSAVFGPGRISLIGGRTGAGKSTLLYILGGLLRPSVGEVLADGEPVSRWTSPHRDLWRRRVGFMFQSTHLIHDLTVLENVILPLIPCGMSVSELRSLGVGTLERVGIPHLAGKLAAFLSGGERQKAALARAIVSRPRFLLVDEPTAHQDDRSAERVLCILSEMKARDATVIVATHDPRVLDAALADGHWHIEDGAVGKIR